MDYNDAIKDLQFYLSEKSFLHKITSLDELKHVQTPAISLVLTQAGNVYYLPDDVLFKKGISFLDDDWVDFESLEVEKKLIKARLNKQGPKESSSDVIRQVKSQIIKSSNDLLVSITDKRMIKSGYWELFSNCKEIKLNDSILILKNQPDLSTVEELSIIKGPFNQKSIELPEFLSTFGKAQEYTYRTTPKSNPPRKEEFLSYRELQKANKLNWKYFDQIRTYLGSIWNERDPSTVFSRINLLFESAVLITEKHELFNKILQVDKEQKMMVGIPSNFILGICGGYARGEFSDTSDLDMLLIHEGNDKQFLQVGEALNQVLQNTPNLELCKLENLVNLNFHEDSIEKILQAFLEGDEHFLEGHQRKELEKMIESVETLRKTPTSPEERKDGVSKYCWSIYKSLVNMVPIYEKPIGKGPALRERITKLTKQALPDIIPILLRTTESLKDNNNVLGENLRRCQPFLYDSIFKTYSVLTALQDVSTILAILSEGNFTTSTANRLKIAKEYNLITEEHSSKLIDGYNSFAGAKYKLTREMPIKAVELINEELKIIIRNVYNNILENLEPVEASKTEYKIAYPLLIFSDLHWGLNDKLAKLCLEEIKKVGEMHQVRSIIIAGDIFNVDRYSEMLFHSENSDKEGTTLINELSQIQSSLGDQRIHIISGNHDPEKLYKKFNSRIERELDIHFIGETYKDDYIWVEHGDQDFWSNFNPPFDHYIPQFKSPKSLSDQKVIVGHNHRIYDEESVGFYANGTIGKSFSAILVNKNQIKLLKLPVQYEIDLEKTNKEYEGILNAEELIDEYVRENFKLIKWDKFCSDIRIDSDEKETWIIIQDNLPTGFIPFNMVKERSKLENIRVFEVAFPINYTFTLGQNLKEAWGIFSITGESILPVMNQDNQIIGTLSIFSVPKPEKEHAETKEAEISDEMKNVGNSLIEKLLEKEKKIE